MALETIVYPQVPFTYNCNNKELLSNNNNNWDNNVKDYWDNNIISPPEEACGVPWPSVVPVETDGRRKRRRSKTRKNEEEVENQRMTHIAVERNRRKQMNEYLAVLRTLMPPSYAQRGDQASIIGGAINFVKELEQHLQTLEAHKKTNHNLDEQNGKLPSTTTPFAQFFSYPQYSTNSSSPFDKYEQSAVADIEVAMVETHANLKILTKRRSKQLLKMVNGFQCLKLNVLHLNVTSVEEMVLYSVSVKVEDGCQLTTVDEIAAAVNKLLGQIEEEALC